ncbi:MULTISPECIES: uroporphyrinogen decarboxylase/cobalamine-independent methonine synthase family protein [Micrococcaceae]|uniref:hypothetical protein n=1 Tax=unclassified Kocuria TaxID=2649579 RepID=UPI001013B2D7|nr:MULTISPECIES: hypothetical protein [unclassified Kocuria]
MTLNSPSGGHSPRGDRIVASSRGRVSGTEFYESLLGVRGELGAPHLSPLPELPERGFSATRTARTIASLEELYADGQPFGWRLGARPSKESRAAASQLHSDINILADVIGSAGRGHKGHTVVSLTGPVSLAAELKLRNGEAVLSDHGARRELADSLCEGLGSLTRALRTAVDGEGLTVRWCEPDLEQALAGQIPTSSGYRTLRSIPRAEVRNSLADIAEATQRHGVGSVIDVGGPVPDMEFGRFFDAIAARPHGRGADEWERIAGAVDRGQSAWLGVTGSGAQDQTVETIRSFWRTWRDLGLGAQDLAKVTIEEEDDLSTVSPERGLTVQTRSAAIAEGLLDLSRE